MKIERVAPAKHGTHPVFHSYLDMSVADAETSLQGVSYPATKHDLIHQGKMNGASSDVMAFLRIMPEGRYTHFNDIASMA
ncbi:hypothetical protein DGWBC_1569 [Dehalogenimonas sp. WBC-2]|nr:hypothetical protein DGWBC_1569 [Dehalogenimonas sp. WBC-2]